MGFICVVVFKMTCRSKQSNEQYVIGYEPTLIRKQLVFYHWY